MFDDDAILTCGNCGYTAHFDLFDIAGACPDHLFCQQCNCEIDASDGQPVERCGNCLACANLPELK